MLPGLALILLLIRSWLRFRSLLPGLKFLIRMELAWFSDSRCWLSFCVLDAMVAGVAPNGVTTVDGFFEVWFVNELLSIDVCLTA